MWQLLALLVAQAFAAPALRGEQSASVCGAKLRLEGCMSTTHTPKTCRICSSLHSSVVMAPKGPCSLHAVKKQCHEFLHSKKKNSPTTKIFSLKKQSILTKQELKQVYQMENFVAALHKTSKHSVEQADLTEMAKIDSLINVVTNRERRYKVKGKVA